MHFHVGFQVLFLASLSFFKPDKPTLVTKYHKDHKANKIARAHKSRHVHSRTVADTAITTGCTTRAELITFAKSLTGIPYRFGCSDPEKGFDCSGFVNYVFEHFGIAVPRSSSDFVAVEGRIDLKDAQPGDLILFTGTKSYRKRSAGHIGIIISQPGEPVAFIHSTSGNANGVTETPLNDYYLGRYIKTIRLFSENMDTAEDSPVSETASANPLPQ